MALEIGGGARGVKLDAMSNPLVVGLVLVVAGEAEVVAFYPDYIELKEEQKMKIMQINKGACFKIKKMK